jgi:hypothetical protein
MDIRFSLLMTLETPIVLGVDGAAFMNHVEILFNCRLRERTEQQQLHLAQLAGNVQIRAAALVLVRSELEVAVSAEEKSWTGSEITSNEGSSSPTRPTAGAAARPDGATMLVGDDDDDDRKPSAVGRSVISNLQPSPTGTANQPHTGLREANPVSNMNNEQAVTTTFAGMALGNQVGSSAAAASAHGVVVVAGSSVARLPVDETVPPGSSDDGSSLVYSMNSLAYSTDSAQAPTGGTRPHAGLLGGGASNPISNTMGNEQQPVVPVAVINNPTTPSAGVVLGDQVGSASSAAAASAAAAIPAETIVSGNNEAGNLDDDDATYYV